jgi:hypothetical protein
VGLEAVQVTAVATLIAAAIAAVVGIASWKEQRKTAEKVERLREALATRARRGEYLRSQITNLYGPLAFLLESTEIIFEWHNELHRGYDEYFKDRHGTSDEMNSTIAAANRYGAIAKENNKSAVELLKNELGLDRSRGYSSRK